MEVCTTSQPALLELYSRSAHRLAKEKHISVATRGRLEFVVGLLMSWVSIWAEHKPWSDMTWARAPAAQPFTRVPRLSRPLEICKSPPGQMQDVTFIFLPSTDCYQLQDVRSEGQAQLILHKKILDSYTNLPQAFLQLK